MTLTQLQEASRKRQREWCPDPKEQPDLSFRGVELAGEVGEACNIIKKLERARHGWRGSKADLKMLAEELADAIIVVSLIANDVGIDLNEAVPDKFNETSEKYGLHVFIEPDGTTSGL
jgi:Predicted pyrophosphatase